MIPVKLSSNFAQLRQHDPRMTRAVLTKRQLGGEKADSDGDFVELLGG
jgi:hypothetical protein